MPRTILVSNRLPVRIAATGRPERTTGGLASALAGASVDALWIGWPGAPVEELGDLEALRAELATLALAPVYLDQPELDGYYEGYSNATLWPLLHSMASRVAVRSEWFATYEAVNRRFAEVVLDHAAPGDTVWLHDFHLLLLPRMLRQADRDLRIGFFLHTPFPSSDVFRILPEREQLLSGLLGADLIGFHTYSYLRHFRSTLLRVLGLESEMDSVRQSNHLARLGVHPIGHDHAGLSAAIATPEFTRAYADHAELLGEHRLVLGVERLDYTKGIPQKLAAIREFLASHPDWRTGAIFMLIAVPSRRGIREYDELTEEVQREVGAINGEFGAVGHVPVHFLHQGFPMPELAAMYALAEVCVVTPLVDGMNLVAKEYIACKAVCPAARPGVLVLSEFAGAAREMSEAVRVNPHDVRSVANAIAVALAMDAEERRRRTDAMGPLLVRRDAAAWANTFLAQLAAGVDAGQPAVPHGSLDDLALALAGAVRKGRRLALFLDYDGTLREFTADPNAAVPGPELRSLLRDLAASAGVSLSIVSGRPTTFLERCLGDLEVDLVAEHGYRWRLAGEPGWQLVQPDVHTAWIDLVRPVLQQAADRTPGSFVEEKSSALVWHYRQAEPEYGAWRANMLLSELTDVTASLPVAVHHGRKIVEVTSQLVSKGAVVRRLITERSPDIAVAAGDDQTDETMFGLEFDGAPELHTIGLGEGPSRAQRRSNISDLHDFLRLLQAELVR